MIHIHQILKHIRKRLDYSPTYIINKLGRNRRTFNEMENKYCAMKPELLISWLNVLDIPPEDHTWFLTHHKKEIIFHKLPREIDVKIRLALATAAALDQDLSDDTINKVVATIIKDTNPRLLKRPRLVDNVIDRILIENSE